MFNFKESSWFIQYWVYLHTQVGLGVIPSRTNLCTMFWKTVLITPVSIILAICPGIPVLLLGATGYGFYRLFSWLGVGRAFRKMRLGNRIVDALEEGCDVIDEFFTAKKKKWCPIIKITDEEESPSDEEESPSDKK